MHSTQAVAALWMFTFLVAGACSPSSDDGLATAEERDPLALHEYCAREADLSSVVDDTAECAVARSQDGSITVRYFVPQVAGPWLVSPIDPVDSHGRLSPLDQNLFEAANLEVVEELGMDLRDVDVRATRHLMVRDSDSRDAARAVSLKTFFRQVIDGIPVHGSRGVVSRSLDGSVTGLTIAWTWLPAPAGADFASSLQAAAGVEAALEVRAVWVQTEGGLMPGALATHQTYNGDRRSFMQEDLFVDGLPFGR